MRGSKDTSVGNLIFTARKGRLLKVRERTWKWRCGRDMVIAYSDDGQRLCDSAANILGMTPDNFQRGRWKRTSDGMVTPGQISKWIASKS